jgi:hypothetical protein
MKENVVTFGWGKFKDPDEKDALCAAFVDSDTLNYKIFAACSLTEEDENAFQRCKAPGQMQITFELNCDYTWKRCNNEFWAKVFFLTYCNQENVKSALRVFNIWRCNRNDYNRPYLMKLECNFCQIDDGAAGLFCYRCKLPTCIGCRGRHTCPIAEISSL